MVLMFEATYVGDTFITFCQRPTVQYQSFKAKILLLLFVLLTYTYVHKCSCMHTYTQTQVFIHVRTPYVLQDRSQTQELLSLMQVTVSILFCQGP